MKAFILLITCFFCIIIHSLKAQNGEKPRAATPKMQATLRNADEDPKSDSLKNLSVEQIIDYYDQVEAMSDWAPHIPKEVLKKIGDYDKFQMRYSEYVSQAVGPGFFSYTSARALPKKRRYTIDSSITAIEYITPHPLKDLKKDKEIEVGLLAYRDYDSVRVTFSKIDGEPITELWKGKLLKGSAVMKFAMNPMLLPTGKYLILLKDESGKVIASRRLFVKA